MKLWEIKAQSLRIMFTDTDVEYSETDFSSRVVYENANTKDKLVRIEDSIRRAIDTFYLYLKEPTTYSEVGLTLSGEDYLNYLDFSANATFGFPSRVDIRLVNDDDEITYVKNQVDFSFDPITKRIYFMNSDYRDYEDSIKFIVWYKIKKVNIPYGSDEMSFDLDSINIPEEVQRMIPFFVKGELYEEDEPDIARIAKNDYINFLMSLRKPFSNVQTKVKKSNVFNKTN